MVNQEGRGRIKKFPGTHWGKGSRGLARNATAGKTWKCRGAHQKTIRRKKASEEKNVKVIYIAKQREAKRELSRRMHLGGVKKRSKKEGRLWAPQHQGV